MCCLKDWMNSPLRFTMMMRNADLLELARCFGGNWNLFSRSCLPIFRAKLPVQYFCHYVFSWQSLYILDFSDKGTAQTSGILLLQNGCKHIFFPNKNSMCIYTLNLAIFVFTSELIMIFWLGFWKNLG